MPEQRQDGREATDVVIERSQYPSFTVHLSCELTPAQAWRRIVDVEGHGQIVPLTTGAGPRPEELQVGDRLVARTAVGPLGFDDVMIVRALVPGQRVMFEKVGRLIGGFISVSCEPRADAESRGSLVQWSQSIAFPFLPGPVSRVVGTALAPALRSGYRVMLARLLRA